MTSRRFLLAYCLCFLTAGASARAETVTVTTGQDDPPFTDSSRPDGGIATRLVLEAFRAAGDQPKLDWLPWRRGYSLTKSATYQASFPYLKTPERERDFFYSDPIFTDFSYLWTRAGDTLSSEDPARFKDKAICIPQAYHSPLQDLLAAMIARGEVKLVRPETLKNCIQMLAAGRIDAMSGEEDEIAVPLRAMGLAGLVTHGPTPIAQLEFYLIFPRAAWDSTALRDRFNAALQRMKEDGRYAALMAR